MQTICDPYFDTNRCVLRLKKWYDGHKTLIVAFDWDDTCHDYHNKGYEYSQVMTLLKECSHLGFTLILFSTNEDDLKLESICEYLQAEQGIKVHLINEGPIMQSARKPYYNVLLDDKAGLGQGYNTLRTVVNLIKQERGENEVD